MNEEETFHLSPWVRSYVLEAEEGEGEEGAMSLNLNSS